MKRVAGGRCENHNLVTLSATGSNGGTSLEKALAYAREVGGLDLRLATWEILDPGLLPPVPTLAI